jgi:hypothetical protein
MDHGRAILASKRGQETIVLELVVAYPYAAHEDARLIADAERYGCEVLGVMG